MTDRLYILQKKPQAVMTVNADGSDLRTILAGLVGEPDGVQVDVANGTIYWTNMGVDIHAADGTIERADLDGGNRRLLVGDGAVVTPKQLKADLPRGHLYFCDREGMRVMRCDLDGGDVTVLVRTGRFPADRSNEDLHCVGIALDLRNRRLYWSQKGPSDGGRGRIFRVGMDQRVDDPDNRQDVELLMDGLPEPIDLAFDEAAGYLYWTDRAHLPGGNTLNRVKVDERGASGHEIIASGLEEGIGVTLDLDNQRAFTTDLGGKIRVADLKPGAMFTTIAEAGPMTGLTFVQS